MADIRDKLGSPFTDIILIFNSASLQPSALTLIETRPPSKFHEIFEKYKNKSISRKFFPSPSLNKMEILTNNNAFQHIYEKIFVLLDHKTLLMCRLVNQSWNTILCNPIFWVLKCGSLNARKKNCSVIETKNLHKAWMNLIARPENTNDLTKNKNNVTLCLIRMHKYLTVDSFSLYQFLPPLHVAALAGDLNLVKFILENSDDDTAGQKI